MHVLAIDDDLVGLRMLCDVLKFSGHAVSGFSRGIPAIHSLQKAPDNYHLVITDYALPDMDGLSLFRRIREISSALPVLLISGALDAETETLFYREGGTHILRKPIEVRELNAVLASV